MISQLTIQNFGLIDRLTVNFCENLNIFTGETGAGKSILIDALRYALGERLNTAQVRDPGKPCTVEIVINLSDEFLKESSILEEYICDDDPVLIISRTCLGDKRAKNRINGFNVTVSQLKEIGDRLVDFHGPHDHQMLLSEDSHIGILDRLSGPDELKNEYTQKYDTCKQLQKKLNDLHSLSENRERELDMLGHQIKELEQVPLEEDAYEKLSRDLGRVNNAEKLHEYAGQLVDVLENGETGLSDAVSRAFVPMEALARIDGAAEKFAEVLTRIQEDTSELSYAITAYLESLSFQPGEADEINNRYDVYYEILRKYGPTLEDARNFLEKAREKHGTLADLEHNDAKLRSAIDAAEKELKQLARKITAKRKKAAQALEETIEKELKELGIKHVRFECRVEKTELNSGGGDKVIFYISPNAGEDLKPLAEIISSGEAARVMLALKKALTKVDPIPILIFDEIDAQIGGRLGAVTGKKLKELSHDRQVLLITHLPQIASFGDYHFKVLKKIKDNRTITDVSFLDDDTRVKELAKMMSGEKESRIALDHARDMFERAKK